MNSRDFVRAIKAAVSDAAAQGTLDVIEKPPGRRPDQQLVELSQWFHGLTPESRKAVVQIVELTANQATYNFLLALDGLLALEPTGAKGSFELFYVRGELRERIDNDNAEQLSFLFKE